MIGGATVGKLRQTFVSKLLQRRFDWGSLVCFGCCFFLYFLPIVVEQG